jgi:hypothetical protein
MKTVFFALLIASTILLAKAEPSSDVKIKSELAETLLLKLKTGQFDALESEYQDFQDPHQRLPEEPQSDGQKTRSVEKANGLTPGSFAS